MTAPTGPTPPTSAASGAQTTQPPAPSDAQEGLGTQASRTGRNVLLMAAAMKLLEMGSMSVGTDKLTGLAELALGLGCLLTYELTD